MKISIPVLLSIICLLAGSKESLANMWALMVPDLKIAGPTVTSTNKWLLFESFATLAECNDRRASTIRQIDKERRAIKDKDVDGPDVEITERELRLLWDIYTRSKCVQSR
jgi:hypothetical protein